MIQGLPVRKCLGFAFRIVICFFGTLLLTTCCMLPRTTTVRALSAVSPMSNVRIELFFKDNNELRERVHFLAQKGVKSFNLVNKNRHDELEEWVDIIREEVPDSSVCAHFSLKYNKSGKRVGGDDASYGIFSSFVQSICSNSNNNKKDEKENKQNTEVLLISGSGKKSKLDAVNTLKRLEQERKMFSTTTAALPKIGVAFNPFFPSKEDSKLEQNRLLKKIQTEQVDKIYLQFGSNLERLRSSLQWLSEIRCEQEGKGRNLEICGSIFLPTPKLIAQQKFRPWNGVFLCDEFLGSPTNARQIVLQMMKLYEQYNVEILIEAPGVRNDKDMALVECLVRDRESLMVSQQPQKQLSNDEESTHDDGGSNVQASAKKEEVILDENDASDTTIKRLIPSPLVSTEALQKPAIVLFGSFDVRMHDNRAVELASCHSHVIPLFLWSSKEQGQWGVTGALQVVLKDALRNLHDRLESNGLQLVCRNTDNTAMELAKICSESGASAVYWNKEHTTESRLRDTERKRVLAAQSSETDHNIVTVVECQSSLLYDPEKIRLSSGFNGGHWGTLMPFLKGCQKQLGEPPRPAARHETFAILESMKGPSKWPAGVDVDQLDMAVIKGNHKWDIPILERYSMSEDAASGTLKEFFTQGFSRYETERSRADLEWSTSKLSAHLRIGTLSPNELYHKTQDSGLPYEDTKTFSRRLIWRDLAYYQLYSFPSMRDQPIRKHYESTEWVTGDEERRRLEAWKWGKTGYPIVDAGMRELYATGWMTQSVRMIVASFLVEYLRVNWVKGCEWFHYTLVDADSAINPMMWNNAGRSGIDQWNFVLSPENASQDGTGEYTKKWVPELAGLSKPLIHKPWQAPKEVLERAGVVLGKTYPHRIVTDLKEERQHSVDSVLKMRRNAQEYNDKRGYDIITLPNGENTVVFTKKEYRIDGEGNLMKGSGKTSNRVGKSKRRRRR